EFVAGETYERLGQVITLLAPGRGTFDQDTSASSMPIEPEGFNDPNELITSITYVKAPEFVRMIEQMIGKEKFVKGLHLYHTRYKHSNATRKQWISCMEEVSHIKLSKMADQWLKRTGFPIVKVKTSYDDKKKKYTLLLDQGKNHWTFPFTFSLYDDTGRKMIEKTERITSLLQKITVSVSTKPSFASLNNGYSFYGKVIYIQTKEKLLLQIQHDQDLVGKFLAWMQLINTEKERLLAHRKSEVSSFIIDTYFTLLNHKELVPQTGSQFFALFETVDDPIWRHCYQDLYDVRKKIQKAIARKYHLALKKMYHEYAQIHASGSYLQKEIHSIKNRQMKNLCLVLLSTLDTPEIQTIIKKQYDEATCATDRGIAFKLYIESSAHDT
ncbi:MAG: DUF3458 domain-containing protein, partial [Nitrosarchaeum sp.]|nr:DUF3458 domain-containing protein [Nitrosarchaeum sp.]